MRKYSIALAVLAVLGLGFSIFFPSLATAQPATDVKSAADAKGEDATHFRGAKGDNADAPPREQSIYVPYDKLRQVFERHGRGVFLPYEKFEELWRAARDHARPVLDPKPPVAAVITDIDSVATVERDVLRVRARLKIDVLAKGWNEVPLRLSDAAITKATIGDQPARILGGQNQDYRLLVEKKGKQPEQIALDLEYAKAVSRMPGQNSVSFQAPQAAVNRWKVTIGQAGVKLNIHPVVAAPDAGKPTSDGDKGEKEETVLVAYVGSAAVVRIDWTPKSEGATGLSALASVQTEQQVWVEEGAVYTRAKLQYTISRAELSQLKIEVPADQVVGKVSDANVRQWSVEKTAEGQQITVQLFEPAKSAQTVTLELKRFEKPAEHEKLKVPMIKAVGVDQQQGVVVVSVDASLRAETTVRGLSQIDAGDLPQALRGTAWTYAYRYSTVPYELALAIEKVQPRISVDMLVETTLEPERLTTDLTAVFEIERAGVFRLELLKPEGFEVRQVRGREVAGAKAAQVNSYQVEGEKKDRLVVSLPSQATGRVAVVVELQRELPQREALAEPGKAAELKLAMPQTTGAAVARASGRMILYAPENVRVTPGKSEGMAEISFEKALAEMTTARDRKPADARPALAMSFVPDAAATLAVSVERRKPKVTISQLVVARIETGVMKYTSTLNYNVEYSGIKALRVDVPQDIAAGLRVETPGISEKAIEPQPDDVAKGYIAWRLSSDAELLGQGKINLVWEKRIAKLDVGKSVEISVPSLRPRAVDRAWGQIVLTKAEALEINADEPPASLRPIDPQLDLMESVAGAARAFEFHDDWKLAIVVTQYELTDLKRTSIERGLVRMVVTPAGETSVQALFRFRSARQRLEVTLDDKVEFAAAPLWVNGQSKTLERGQGGQYFIPLADSNPEQSQLLELRYSIRGGSRRLALPVFPQEAAVQKVYLSVYLPVDEALLAATGPWTPQFQWRLSPQMRWHPQPQQPEGQLLGWVREGLSVAGRPSDDFQTDGQNFIFATAGPPAPPEGDLRIVAMNRAWFHGLMFALVAVGGVVLLPVPLGGRAAAIGVLIVVLVLGGVFWPTLAMQLLSPALLSALMAVLVLWIVWFFLRTWPTIAADLARRREAAAAAATRTVAEAAPAVPPAEPAPPTPPAQLGEGGSHE